MCGIFGWMGEPDPELARRARDTLSNRGPDDAGEYRDQARGVWLGHRRLSILDLSPEGHQPMESPGGRYVLTYNGEVFNYPDLRRELEGAGVRFRGQSDTEVVAAALDAWGVREAVRRFVGMFAFGVYDREEACLWLVRDRLGIKPLYYAHSGHDLAFASELRPLRTLPWLDDRIDTGALDAYFRYLCVPSPATILRGARKLPPGTLLRWDRRNLRTERYWDLREVVRDGRANPLACDFREAADELEGLLSAAVRLRMRSDVPLGAFLSGGIDSSLVVALMQRQSPRPVSTFTIGFTERSHDESPHAQAVAAHLGTDHHVQVVSPRTVQELIPRIAGLYDEPFADGSSVPTYLLSRFARERVTVALSGDGGDELFGGYPRYFWGARIQRWRGRLTPVGARVVGKALGAVPAGWWDGPVARLGGRRFAGAEGLAARVRRLGGYLACAPEDVYEEMVSAWPDPGVLTGSVPADRLGPDPRRFGDLPWAEQMMATDAENYLVDDILTKVDRATMAVSLEARVPVLDHRVVEWSWRVPQRFKLSPTGDRGKLLLREVLHRHVPRELIDRPKMGFGMPMGSWLRQELRPWAEELLGVDSIRADGLLDPAPIRRAWAEHLSGEDRLSRLWTVLMFLQWRQDSRAVPQPAEVACGSGIP